MESKSKNSENFKNQPQPTQAGQSSKSSSEVQENVESPGIESSSCLITPTNISIGHLYVYNFSTPSKKNRSTCSIEIPFSAKKIKVQSPAASSGPICRICHEGDGSEDLLSPCNCAGTVGLVHMSCMERWLSLASRDKCELCNYKFITIRSPKTFKEWLRSSRDDPQLRRALVSDLLCFLLLTPLAGVSSFLCVEGAKKQIIDENSLEAGCLMALATFLVTIYFIWNILTCRFHLDNFLKWRSSNHTVKVLRVRRLSSPLPVQRPSLSYNLDISPEAHSNSTVINVPERLTGEQIQSHPSSV